MWPVRHSRSVRCSLSGAQEISKSTNSCPAIPKRRPLVLFWAEPWLGVGPHGGPAPPLRSPQPLGVAWAVAAGTHRFLPLLACASSRGTAGGLGRLRSAQQQNPHCGLSTFVPLVQTGMIGTLGITCVRLHSKTPRLRTSGSSALRLRRNQISLGRGGVSRRKNSPCNNVLRDPWAY